MKKFTLYWFVAMILSSKAWANDNWLQRQQQYSLQTTLSHISRVDTPRGFIVASPSKSEPNYYYHWVRDAALVMQALDKSLDWDQKRHLFNDYVKMTLQNQKTPTLSELGEPKFNADGSAYSGDWARPQNDGPALRAISLINFANQLLDRNEQDYVNKFLFNNDPNSDASIRRDLEYTMKAWRRPDYDLWEEVHGFHFYTRMSQRSALALGAKLAIRLGDNDSARIFQDQADQINSQLERHWSNKEYKILSTIDRTEHLGLGYKSSNLDGSIVLAMLHSWLPGQSFGVLDERIQVTAVKMIRIFSEIYNLNHSQEGVGIGRYPEDQYYGGNPWFLLTLGFAEFFEKLSCTLQQNGEVAVTGVNKPLFTYLLGTDILPGHYDQNSNEFLAIQAGLKAKSQAFLLRVQNHAGHDGQLDEQFDRNSGFMRGAPHLTWSYAAFMTYFAQRTKANAL